MATFQFEYESLMLDFWSELKPSHLRRALIQWNPHNDIGGVIQVIQVIQVILSPSCILIEPLVMENTPLISFSDTEWFWFQK